MKELFFDTETTGKWNWKLPEEHPDQPELVQLAAWLREDGVVRLKVNLLVEPDGYTISDEVAAIHGKTQAMCANVGMPLNPVVRIFREMARKADIIVAHNLAFDRRVMSRACALTGVHLPWDKRILRCSMLSAMDILKIPKDPRFHWARDPWKYPSLEETHKHYYGTSVEDAHDADGDVAAMVRIYDKLVEEGCFHETERSERAPSASDLPQAV